MQREQLYCPRARMAALVRTTDIASGACPFQDHAFARCGASLGSKAFEIAKQARMRWAPSQRSARVLA
jgi:surfactin synthase thioesterase subunit